MKYISEDQIRFTIAQYIYEVDRQAKRAEDPLADAHAQFVIAVARGVQMWLLGKEEHAE